MWRFRLCWHYCGQLSQIDKDELTRPDRQVGTSISTSKVVLVFVGSVAEIMLIAGYFLHKSEWNIYTYYCMTGRATFAQPKELQ